MCFNKCTKNELTVKILVRLLLCWSTICFSFIKLISVHLLLQDVRIDKQLQSGLRVTVKLNKMQNQGNFVCLIDIDNVWFMFFRRKDLMFLQISPVCVSIRHPQRANCVKAWLWLLTCPGLKEGFTGVTLSAWHLPSVGFLCLWYYQACAPHWFATGCRNKSWIALFYSSTHPFTLCIQCEAQPCCDHFILIAVIVLIQAQCSQKVPMKMDMIWRLVHQREAATLTKQPFRHSSRFRANESENFFNLAMHIAQQCWSVGWLRLKYLNN